ncbi:MAG: phosphate-starvation-inducible PsiE family protein, partial [Thermodesulfobacteriota bacterium]|nr:phosphate-starvation-inducible PsiE family protein [Thermodesulfobacteriota bacterium]
VLTTLLIVFSVMDVVWVMFRRLSHTPILVLRINDILYIFGALLVVLIAIEIFINITLYLREDIIHVKLVIATALMAIARKVIVLDYKEIGHEYVYATAAVVLALGITYFLITLKKS